MWIWKRTGETCECTLKSEHGKLVHKVSKGQVLGAVRVGWARHRDAYQGEWGESEQPEPVNAKE